MTGSANHRRGDSGASRVEALNYRCLRFVSQGLGPFHVLVGPNASGKSTFLDAVVFLGDLIRVGLQAAVYGDARLGVPLRAPDAKQLTWMRKEPRFELAVEFGIPSSALQKVGNSGAEVCRYEVAIDVEGPLRIAAETLWLKPVDATSPQQLPLFPQPLSPRDTIVQWPSRPIPKGWRKVVSRSDEPERVTFASETSGWKNPFRIAADKSALASLPEDEEKFPVATWFRRTLAEGVQRIALSSERMRLPSPPGRSQAYLPDGSNLPQIVDTLEKEHPERLRRWVAHVREALPDIEAITTREREEDRHRFLVLRHSNGLETPSWLVSDGTLRLLALTLLAYVPDLSGLYLIEEPENGIHPRAVETVFQSLSSVYGAQVLLATHSPVVVSMAKMDQVLCFARTSQSATAVVHGPEHPKLRDWKGDTDLGTLLAAGVLD